MSLKYISVVDIDRIDKISTDIKFFEVLQPENNTQ